MGRVRSRGQQVGGRPLRFRRGDGSMGIRRLVLTLLVSVCALAGLLLSWGAVAQGEVAHHYLSQFNEVPANLGGPLTLSSSSMTADSGHVWVAEPTRVDEFDAATGSFLSQLTHAEGFTY